MRGGGGGGGGGGWEAEGDLYHPNRLFGVASYEYKNY